MIKERYLCLQICLRVPIRVENDDRVGRLQVDSQPASSGGQKEQEQGRFRRVKRCDLVLAIFVGGVSVDSAVLKLSEPHVVFEDIKHFSHLREDQHSRATLLQFLQQFIE